MDRVNYPEITHESEIESQSKSIHIAQENHVHFGPLPSTHSALPAPRQPSLGYGSEREPLGERLNDPIKGKYTLCALDLDMQKLDGKMDLLCT